MRKKIVTGLFLLAAAAMAAGCGKKEAEQTALDDKTLPEIIDRIYEEKDPGLAVATAEVDLTDADALKYSTGLDSPEGIEAAAVSEAMISAQAYSMVLVRTEDSKNTEETARAMQEGIDPATAPTTLLEEISQRAAPWGVLSILIIFLIGGGLFFFVLPRYQRKANQERQG